MKTTDYIGLMIAVAVFIVPMIFEYRSNSRRQECDKCDMKWPAIMYFVLAVIYYTFHIMGVAYFTRSP